MKTLPASVEPAVAFVAPMTGLYSFGCKFDPLYPPSLILPEGRGFTGDTCYLEADDELSYACGASFQLAGARLGDELTDELEAAPQSAAARLDLLESIVADLLEARTKPKSKKAEQAKEPE